MGDEYEKLLSDSKPALIEWVNRFKDYTQLPYEQNYEERQYGVIYYHFDKNNVLDVEDCFQKVKHVYDNLDLAQTLDENSFFIIGFAPIELSSEDGYGILVDAETCTHLQLSVIFAGDNSDPVTPMFRIVSNNFLDSIFADV